ncbi:MAG: threonine synthase, partial [Planctomycetota bacterium]|nr:threonine synthase [Planctomycetota bacterium]
MNYYNIRVPEQRVSFAEAVCLGLGRDRGLFLPERLRPFEDLPALLELDFVPRSARILGRLIGDGLEESVLREIVEAAFDFPVPLVPVDDRTHALELFHGPSLAFKDFGARFMAQ